MELLIRVFKAFEGKRSFKYRVLFSLLILFQFVRAASAESPHEYQIKAVFLYNFALFVDWPRGTFADPREPIVIGVLGKDPFGRYLDEVITGEKIKGRSLIIHRYSRVEDVKDCHILFISSSESQRLEKIFSALRGHPVLTVGDFEGFASRGGMIRLTNEQNKVRLRINIQSTETAGLTLSSKLLRPADIVAPGKD